MRNLLIAAVGAVTLSTLVACSDSATGPSPADSLAFSHAEGDPSEVTGNPTCAVLGDDWVGYELKIPDDGSFGADHVGDHNGVDGVVVTVSSSPDDEGEYRYFDWAISGGLVHAVLSKGANSAYLYDYRDAGATSDDGLHSPVAGGSGKPAGISHINFCYVPVANGNGKVGCTTGYWRNHADRWTGATPTDPFDDVAGLSNVYGPDYTMAHAIWQGGGGKDAVARQGAAALLNALAAELDPDDNNYVDFGATVQHVQDLIAAGDHEALTALNEQGDCPLSGSRAEQVENPHNQGGKPTNGNSGQGKGGR
jgi:hypothetical protein